MRSTRPQPTSAAPHHPPRLYSGGAHALPTFSAPALALPASRALVIGAFVVGGLVVGALGGCDRAAPPAAPGTPAGAPAGAAPSPPSEALLALTPARASAGDLLLLYRDKEGVEQRAMTTAEVPEASRAAVQVIDLSRSPQARAASRVVQIFDLRAPNPDGLYPGRLVPREELERALASAQALPAQPAVVMYSTAWCGVCKKARKFMRDKGISFVEKDIEKDKEGARELQDKARRAGLALGGVPVIDVGGRLMSGFDEQALLSALSAPPAKPSTPPPSAPPKSAPQEEHP